MFIFWKDLMSDADFTAIFIYAHIWQHAKCEIKSLQPFLLPKTFNQAVVKNHGITKIHQLQQ